MSKTLADATRATLETTVVNLMTQVDQLLAQGQSEQAQQCFNEAQRLLPNHPLVLHESARRMLSAGDAESALALFQAAAESAPNYVQFWLSVAAAERALGRRDAELVTLERALALDPAHLVVLLQKGAVLDLMGRSRAAAQVYKNALDTLSPELRLPPALEAHVKHARSRVAEAASSLASSIEARVGPIRRSDPRDGRQRFERSIAQILGRTKIYAPQPTFMHFPFLTNHEYYPRRDFPWMEELEYATGAIREELTQLLREDVGGMQPYIAYPDGVPLNQWRELNHSRRWGAYFLSNEGARQEERIVRCPQTMVALSKTPQVDIPGRGPTAFFSILDAKTHIPAHAGVTNTRLTVHLPLIVPPGCGFRVGGETREWQVGRAWAFDDTIEHEAWNDSDIPRAILIFDIWHPALTLMERDLVREAMIAIADFYEGEGLPPMGL